MGAGHDHAAGTATGRHRRRLVLVLVLTLSVVGVQVVGGLMSGSLALLADAGHMLTDATGVAIALIATVIAARPATNARTFGLQRGEILAALANAVLLGVLAVWVITAAVRRWNDPPEVASGLMLVVAVAGATANLISLLILRSAREESLNVRGAYLEVLGDLIGSVAVIIAAVVITTTGYTRADIIASVGIGLFILPRAWSLLRDVLDVLLEATPKGMDLDRVREHIRGVPGVLDVHDLHAWTITSGVPVLSAHVVVDEECIDTGRTGQVLDQLAACLGEHFDTDHCTFQLEPAGHGSHEPHQHA
ncbi:cation diffusion facilitator family transporter [Nostocoides sp. F2B08]|jgi:cobalt-zinc-cadmium efflux system protein|uniref:cation diffusion facilitator family transporter n=1 Tax=Nostocoides sp. F2B08 TaxID=2653936 RepID=UPI001263637E|nr:cation diffusion facilitator family transporter [Tetrasphaera sp. F2B08]KAB7740332.1 cation diffusion facilitator family transporter [Tetrasphaera sp. F2B08]